MSLWRLVLSLYLKLNYMKNYIIRHSHIVSIVLSYLTRFEASMTSPSSLWNRFKSRWHQQNTLAPLKDTDDGGELKSSPTRMNNSTNISTTLKIQINIIMWKNGLLVKRNKFALIAEILFSLLFLIILLLLIMKIDPLERRHQIGAASKSVLKMDSSFSFFSSRIKNIYFYPNNSFVKSLCENNIQTYLHETKQTKSNSLYLLSRRNEEFNFIGVNVSDANSLSLNEKINMFAFVSFYNFTIDKEQIIKYTLYTTE
jgi:hypothetical protein